LKQDEKYSRWIVPKSEVEGLKADYDEYLNTSNPANPAEFLNGGSSGGNSRKRGYGESGI
jgi:hypothetical protein